MIPNISLFVFFLISFSRAQDDDFASQCEPKCIFRAPKLNSTNIGQFPKCSKVCSMILIDDTSKLTETQLNKAFKSMKTLVGRLTVEGTKLTNLKCLAGLQKFESKTSGIFIGANPELLELGWTSLTSIDAEKFSVTANMKMTRLKMPKLKNLVTRLNILQSLLVVDNTDPKFCITLSEAAHLLNAKKNKNLIVQGKICKPGNPSKKLCFSPKAGCEQLVGNLNIGAKFDVKKVRSLKRLYGSLIVKNSNLTNFKFLANLTQIIQLDDQKLAIDVQNNPKLTSAAFPKLTQIYSQSMNVAVFKNNHKSLLSDFKSCYALRMATLGDLVSYPYLPTFDGLNCEDMEAKAGK